MKPDWFPDWSGETCLIVASGPSAAGIDLEKARGKCRTIAVNNSWTLVPFADVLYACDYMWWKINRGVPEFHGLKISADNRAREFGCNPVRVLIGLDQLNRGIGEIGRGGGSSGFQALNLAVQWGVSKIILVGFDCSLKNGIHWHGPHLQKLNNPTQVNIRNWQTALTRAAPQLEKMGIEVVNAGNNSSLKTFPGMSLSEAIGI